MASVVAATVVCPVYGVFKRHLTMVVAIGSLGLFKFAHVPVIRMRNATHVSVW